MYLNIYMNIFRKDIQTNNNVTMRKWETTEARKKAFHVHLWIFFFFEPWGIHYLFKKHNRQKFQKQVFPFYLHVNESGKWGGEVAKTNWTNAANESNVSHLDSNVLRDKRAMWL